MTKFKVTDMYTGLEVSGFKDIKETKCFYILYTECTSFRFSKKTLVNNDLMYMLHVA